MGKYVVSLARILTVLGLQTVPARSNSRHFCIRIVIYIAPYLLLPFSLPGQATDRQDRKPSAPIRIGRYIVTHKELLASDAVAILALGADAGSTVHFRHQPFPDTENNLILGPFPSNGQVWGYFAGVAALFVGGNHLVWNLQSKHRVRHDIWTYVTVIAVEEGRTVKRNVYLADYDSTFPPFGAHYPPPVPRYPIPPRLLLPHD